MFSVLETEIKYVKVCLCWKQVQGYSTKTPENLQQIIQD